MALGSGEANRRPAETLFFQPTRNGLPACGTNAGRQDSGTLGRGPCGFALCRKAASCLGNAVEPPACAKAARHERWGGTMSTNGQSNGIASNCLGGVRIVDLSQF